jgi:hypothetical protein
MCIGDIWEVETPNGYRVLDQPAKERVLVLSLPEQVYDLRWFVFEGIDLNTFTKRTFQYNDSNALWWHLLVSAG